VKVLHLLTALGHGGAEMWLLKLIEPLRKLGIDSDFVLKAPELGRLREAAHERGSRTYEVRLGLTHAGYVRNVARLARDEPYDIIHTHEFVYSGPGVLAGRVAHKPTVMTLHHYIMDPQTTLTRRFGIRHARNAYGRLSLRYATRRADVVTAFSKAVMSRVMPSYASDPRCRLLRLCVDVHERASQQARDELRSSLGWAPTAPLIVHAGRFIEQKNHVGIVRIFRRVLLHRPDARLILLGQGPLEQQVIGLAGDLIRRGVVRLLGLREDVPALLSAADVLLFPSLDEGFGLVPLEANACGLPVVGTRVPGLDEALIDGENAYLHAVNDETGMAASVLALVANPKEASEMGNRGRSRAEALYSPRASAELLARVYRDSLLTEGRRGPTRSALSEAPAGPTGQ